MRRRKNVRPRILFPVLLFLLPAVMILSSGSALPCGMSTHGEVCTRAAHYFASELYPEYAAVVQEHPEAYQAGSSFPDWGYSFGYPDASEEAHWPPFLEATALYLRDRCPRPWSEEDERRIAFFLGVISHDIADIDWHGLAGVREGLIDVMSRQEFHGNWGDAHGVADTGGDFVESYEGDMSWLTPWWYFPLEDMAAIYQGMGYEEVTAEVLLPRVLVLFVGATANRAAGRLLYASYAEQSPFLAEQFQDYFPGGLDSMAVRTADWWEDYVGLMEEERIPETAFLAAGRTARCGHGEGRESGEDPQALLAESDRTRVSFEDTEHGVLLRADPLPAAAGEETPSEEPGKATLPGPGLRIQTDAPYSYLGTSLATGDLDRDGLTDLVVGAPGSGEAGRPQTGSVFVFTGRKMLGAAVLDTADADQVLRGTEPAGRFGWALALADMNADGRADLAVSSPSTGAENLEFRGKVVVFFGSDGPSIFSDSPDLVIDGGESYTRLGWSLASGDASGDGASDLLVGAPYAGGGGGQRGIAALYLANGSLRSGTSWGPADAAWLCNGEADYDWFGYQTGVFFRQGENGALVLVGAPGVDSGDAQAVGRLYAYDPFGPDPHRPVFTLTGESEFDKAGSAFLCAPFAGDGGEILALAAPTRRYDQKLWIWMRA